MSAEATPKVSSARVLAAVVSSALAILFGILSVARYLRKKTIVNGLFTTITVATAVCFGAAKVLAYVWRPTVITPTTNAAIMTVNSTAATTGGTSTMLSLAQLGIFALWLCFVLYMVYLYVKPVKRIEATLDKILIGQQIENLSVSKNKQYISIEEKLRLLADNAYKNETRAEKRRAKARERAKAQRELLCEVKQVADSAEE